MNKLEIKNIKYSYYDDGDVENKILKDVSATFESGKFYAIVGESGSGKTTLISLMSALEKLQDGDIVYNGKSITDIGLSKFRLDNVNIVFQAYNLITYMTAVENVSVAVDIAGKKMEKEFAYDILKKVGITKDKADRLVLKLSGGEQQRVSIARSLASDSPIIVADEPTGNLDSDTEIKIINLFKDMAKSGKIVIIVTHSKEVASHADILLKMANGKITAIENNKKS